MKDAKTVVLDQITTSFAKAVGENIALRKLIDEALLECKALRSNCLSAGVIPFNGAKFDAVIDKMERVVKRN